MARSSHLASAPTPTEVDRRRVATDRHRQSVTALLDERSDLHGVHPLADLIYDSVRWSA